MNSLALTEQDSTICVQSLVRFLAQSVGCRRERSMFELSAAGYWLSRDLDMARVGSQLADNGSPIQGSLASRDS